MRKLRDFHVLLLGPAEPPYSVLPWQRDFYDAFEAGTTHGIAGHGPAVEVLVAASVAALWETQRAPRVLMAVPKPLEKEMIQQLELLARRVFRIRRGGNILDVKALRDAFRKVLLGSRVMQIDAPDHWVACGFALDDPMPDWLRNGLMELP